MSKIIVFDEEARFNLKKGADIVANAIRTTYGPRGHNVVFGFSSPGEGVAAAPPIATKDGDRVAKQIDVKDRFVNMGVSLIEEAATKTGAEVGDGSTTSAVLAHAILTEGIKRLAAGADAVSLKHGIEKATVYVVNELQRVTRLVSIRKQMVDIASISAHDAEIGETLVHTVESVGKNGMVTVESGQGLGIEVEYVEGAKFDNGYISPYFINRPERQDTVIDDPYILLTDKKISSLTDLLPALEVMTSVSKNVVIICQDVDGEALSTLVANKLKGVLNCLAVKSPGTLHYGKDMMEDLALITGGQFISSDKGRDLDSITISDLGRAKRVESDKDNTTIIQGRGNPIAIAAKVEEIKSLVENIKSKYVTTIEYETKRYEERLARLGGGIALIRVGAPTELELTEKLHRVRGALAAIKAAAQEGTLPGGGVAYVNAIPALDGLAVTGDELIGAQVVRRALEEPLRQLVTNAGFNSNVVLEVIRGSKDGVGFDVLREEYVDMEDAGIIDATKVVRLALQNAASMAALALVTEALITDKVDEKPGAQPK
jgi:chaperonin GroEL